MTNSSYMIAPGSTNEDLAIKRKLALALMQQGSETAPVQHWAQGLARMAQGALGGYEEYSASKEDKEETAKANALMAQLFTGGSPQAAPQPIAPGAAPVAQSGDMSQPRGIRNNNPLNIEAGRFTQGQPGFAGSDGRFAKFDTPEGGIGAADKLLDVYQKKHGLNTVAGIIGRWAPSSDGNNVSAYATNVARQLGIGPNDPIPPEMRPKLIAAMGQHENGRPIRMASLGGAPSPDSAVPAGAPAAPVQMAQAQPSQSGGVNRDAIVRMLGNRKTAPMAQKIITDQIGQQFKPQNTDDIKEFEYAQRQGFKGSLQDWMASKRGGAGEFGLNPIWGTDEAGRPTVIQLGKGGKAIKSELPPGVQIGKDVIKIDAGTETLLLDPVTRQPIGRVSKNIAEAKSQGEQGEAIGKAKVALPAAESTTKRALTMLEQLEKHEGLNEAVGFVVGRLPALTPKAADFRERVEQIDAMVFGDAVEVMRGLGALTDREGPKVTAARARLKTAKSEEDFRAALKDVREVFKTGIDNMRTKAGAQAPAQPAVPAPNIDDLVKKYSK